MASVIEQSLPARVIAAGPGGADAEFRQSLAALLPEPIVHHGGSIDALQAPLHRVEARAVQGAVRRRVREFTAGRTCARIALDRLGFGGIAVPAGRRREPLWPAGVIGSISHGAGYCAAAVCARNRFAGLGIDIEQATPLSATLVDLVCTPRERRRLAGMDRIAGLAAKIAFSAKEAVFKCLYPVFGTELDFQDVALDLHLHEGRFEAHVSRFALESDADVELTGRIACTSQHVLTAAVLRDDDILYAPEWHSAGRLAGCAGRYVCSQH